MYRCNRDGGLRGARGLRRKRNISMFMKKMAAFLTGALVLALALPVLASAQTPETIVPDAAAPAAQEAAPEAAEEAAQPEKTEAAAAEPEAEPAGEAEPENTPEAQRAKKSAKPDGLALYVDGKDVTGGAAVLNWPDPGLDAPTALLKAVGPDGSSVSPMFETSDDGVVAVDPSGLVTAVGYGVATITATLDTRRAVLQISVGQEVRRVVIIGEDAVAPGRSVKLRAFDQDGNRIRAVWRTSSDKIATISPDGVLTAGRGASGKSVDVTAFAGEGSGVYAVKTVRVE